MIETAMIFMIAIGGIVAIHFFCFVVFTSINSETRHLIKQTRSDITDCLDIAKVNHKYLERILIQVGNKEHIVHLGKEQEHMELHEMADFIQNFLNTPELTKFIDERKPASGYPGKCPVCGEGFNDGRGISTCMKCYTIHHTECWEYNKKCSTFGCDTDACVRTPGS